MKKGIVSIILLFLFMSAIAQIQTGVELGISAGDFSTSGMYTRGKESLFKAGIFINAPLYDKNSKDILETGIYYERKGAKLANFEESTTNYIHTLDVTMDYIQVPLMYGYRFTVSSKINFSLKVGIYGGYAFSASGNLVGFNNQNELFNYKIDKLLTSEQFTFNNQSFALKKFTPWDFGSIVMFDFGLFKNKLLFRFTIEDGAIDLTKYDKRMKTNVETIGIAYNFM